MKGQGCHTGALLLAIASGACGELEEAPEPAPPPGARVVYLGFSDGTGRLEQAESDDPAADRSRLCHAERLGPWQGIPGCGGDRASCQREIAATVDEHFRDFRVVIRTTRPRLPPYTMVVIAPPSGTCRFGTGGAAPLDCEDRLPAEVALVSDCLGSAARCAAIISQEIAHTYGLEHTTVPCDVMADGASCERAAFTDRPARSETRCGRAIQNSYQRLAETVGLWPAGAARIEEWR